MRTENELEEARLGALSTSPPKARKSGDRHIFWRQPNNLATARISGDKFWRRQNLICVEFITYVGIGIINSTHEEVFQVKFHKKFWRQVLASPDFWRPPDYLAVARFSGGLGVHPRTNPPQSCFFPGRPMLKVSKPISTQIYVGP